MNDVENGLIESNFNLIVLNQTGSILILERTVIMNVTRFFSEMTFKEMASLNGIEL